MRKKNEYSGMLSLEDMIEVEEWLKKICVPTIGERSKEEDIAKKLKLKVEYVDSSEFDPHVEAELRPAQDVSFNGLIRVRQDLKGKSFAYLHEIMHYLWDVQIGNPVREVYTRMSQGHTEGKHEQKINYAAASYIIPYVQLDKAISEYDKARPWGDELAFVRGLCDQYGQPRDVVIRRIKEVRAIRRGKSQKNGYKSC